MTAAGGATARVLVSTFGSAGDLFPLMPVIWRLRELGHEVRCAVPRALGLYLRPAGIATYSLGTGTEMRVFADRRLVTRRFDGWHSWRQTVQDYVAPSLGRDVASLRQLIESWQPHVTVTTSFAAAARLAAHHEGVPRLEVSIYPQHAVRLDRSRSFASSFRASVLKELEQAASSGAPGGGSAAVDPALVTELAWGVNDGCVLLHDPALLDRAPATDQLPRGGPPLSDRAVGFPYFDAVPVRQEELEKVDEWLDRADGPAVAVTAGSFLGVRQEQMWDAAARAVEALDVRAVFVGPHRSGREPPAAAGSDILVLGYVPLSQIAPRVSALVHHGGIGTMFAALRAGRPAAVVPQAFDQTHNARLVEAAGAGIDMSRRPAGDLEKVIGRLVEDPALSEGAAGISQALTPRGAATDRVVQHVLARAGVEARAATGGDGAPGRGASNG